jgi:Zn-dependent peptidase ImmA (M78 family)
LRDNFTIAHELGHYILHSDFGKKPAVFKRCGSDRLECEANWFAGAFLMPEEEFKKVFLENNMSVLLTAAYFDVSEKAVKIRKDKLG